MSSARTTAEIQRDPKDDKRKQNERKVRELHGEGLPSIAHYNLQVKHAVTESDRLSLC